MAALVRPARLQYYKLVDADTIAVGAETGPILWARVTSVSESDSEVTIAVRRIGLPVPTTGEAITELTVDLHSALGAREVIDGFTGRPGDAPPITLTQIRPTCGSLAAVSG